MKQLSAEIIGQAVGVLFFSAILFTPILQWHVRKVGNWHITYKQAYIVSIKTWFMALIVFHVVRLTIAFSLNMDEYLHLLIAGISGIASLWFVYSNAILNLPESTGTITKKDARSISTRVICWIIGGAGPDRLSLKKEITTKQKSDRK
jgi:hypothetical protein